MTNKTEIIKALQHISITEDKAAKEVLIAKFKYDFPGSLDWLEMFDEDNLTEIEKYQTTLPKIKGFEFVKSIGSGASGKVFSAIDLATKKQVAIKVPMVFLSKDQMHRFAHESRLLSRLTHKNIAQIYQSGMIEQDELPFIAMEFVDGNTIHQYCKDKQLDFKQIIELFKQVLDAVQYAHNKGIIHRDIKPENILVNENGDVKLLDFGIALATNNSTQQLTQLTKTGEIVGTLAYMSPEQVSGNDELDTRADVYSLGVVLYQLLSNSLPYQIDAGKIFSAISQIIEDLPKKLTTQNHKVDVNLATIVHHAIEKIPESRYQSPRDFKNDLDNWANGIGISVKKQSLWHSLKHLAKQHSAIVIGASLAILGLILGSVFAVSFAFKEHEARARAETNATANQKTVEFITTLFSKANPDRVYGDKLTLLQVIESADEKMLEKLNNVDVETKILLMLSEVYISLGRGKKSQAYLDRIKKLTPLESLTNNSQFKYAFIKSDINVYLSKYDENIIQIQNSLDENKFTLEQQARLKSELAFSLAMAGKLDESIEVLDSLKIIFDGNEFEEDNDFTFNTETFSLITRAKIFEEQSKFNESKKIYESLIGKFTLKFGSQHPQTLSAMNNLSVTEMNIGNLAKSFELLKTVVTGQSENLGEGHLVTLISKSNLLKLLISQGKLEEADVYSLTLIPEMSKHIGSTHKNTLIAKNLRAYLLEDLNKLKAAEELYIEMIADYKSIEDTGNPDYANVLNNSAMLYMKLQQNGKAKTLFEELMLNLDKNISKDHFYTILFSGNYGELLLTTEEYEKAKPLLELSYQGFLKNLGENHERTVNAKRRLEQLVTFSKNK